MAYAEVHEPSVGAGGTGERTKYWYRLKRDWAKGKMSSNDLQQHALAAMESGARGVNKIAAMGNWGENPKNMARALVSALGMPDGAPEIDWFNIPLEGR